MLEPKPAFKERIENLLGSEAEKFFEYCYRPLPNYIRCNTIKISPAKLVERLKDKWEVEQPFNEHPEIMQVNSKLQPGELGKAREHLLGYYYIQELSSMMPAIALEPCPHEAVLDLCASPGSKTTQIAARMQNSGVLIANDIRLDRIIILNSNLERCGVTNVIVTREDGMRLCNKLKKLQLGFEKALVDASCSCEGTIRTEPKILRMWNLKMIHNLSKQQKRLTAAALSVLNDNGILVYSTCTLAPEENEEVVQFLLDNFPMKLEKIKLPVKYREGIEEWQGKRFSSEIRRCCRIYPQDNDSEGFFIAKLRKVR
jgi:NOL1/NOP2/sun family putative RNA methylase